MAQETWVVLLRGINVGGHRKLPMAELKALLESIGCSDVTTYIQSGNVVLRAGKDMSEQISNAIEKAKGVRPDIMSIRAKDFQRIAADNPFPDAESEPKTLHIYFLRQASEGAEARLQPLTGPREDFRLTEEVMYLHCLDFLSGSKIAENAEKLLGVSATARNWNTVSRLVSICSEY